MSTFQSTKQLPSFILMLMLFFLMLDGPWIEAREIEIHPFGECLEYFIGNDDIAVVSDSEHHYGSKTLDCMLVLRSDSGRTLQYFVSDARLFMCGVTISIFDGPTNSSQVQQYHLDCKTAIRLPIEGRTTSNELTVHIKKTEFDVEFSFNISIVNNKGPVHLLQREDYLKKEYDICDPDTLVHNPATIYLPRPGYYSEIYMKLSHESNYWAKCLFVVKTCSECQVGVEAMDPEFDFTSCFNTGLALDDSSRCPHFTFYDSDYKVQTKRSVIASYHLKNYSSESRQLFIETKKSFKEISPYDKGDIIARFRVYSKVKYQEISREGSGSTVEFTSPFFPDPCIQNAETYTIVINNRLDDYFTIIFDDWLLPQSASLKYPANSYFNANGIGRRRSVYSRHHRMQIIFFTGVYSRPGSYFGYPGFKATVTFKNGSLKAPMTDCDMLVDTVGGIIQLDSRKTDGSLRDCIWIIKKPLRARGLQLAQSQILGFVDPSFDIEIREGLVSRGPSLYKFSQSYDHHSLTSSWTTFGDGFYIRITGRLFHIDNLAFRYSAFTYNCDANSKSKFLCGNGHCIAISLRCDGIDHCGDRSDESLEACRTGSSDDDDDDADTHDSVGIIVPLVVSLVVIIFFCIFLVILQRCYRLRLQRLPVGQRSSSSSARRERDRQRRQQRMRAPSVQMSVTVTSGELPPSYNEVMNSTPLSNVNVAFSISPGDENITYTSPPPSYGDAIQAANFDLSRSNSREAAVHTAVTEDDERGEEETTFSNRTATLPTYSPHAVFNPVHTNLSTPQANSSHFSLPVSNADSIVSSFDPNTYVSSSSSTDSYDDDIGDDYVRRSFPRNSAYQFDSSTTDDDDDDNRNDLYIQALNLISVNSSTHSLCDSATSAPAMSMNSNSGSALIKDCCGRNESNKTRKTKKKKKKKGKKENDVVDHRGSESRQNLEENNTSVENGRERRVNWRRGGDREEQQSRNAASFDDRNVYPVRRGRRNRHLERKDNNNVGRDDRRREERRRRDEEQRDRTRNRSHDRYSQPSSNNAYSERRASNLNNAVCSHDVDGDEREEISNYATSTPDRVRSEDRGQCNTEELSRRYIWTSRKARNQREDNEFEPENCSGNGDRGDCDGVSATRVSTPLTVTNYILTPEVDLENCTGSSSVPLAQVLFKTTDGAEASYV